VGHLIGDLKNRSVRGGITTLSAQAVKFGLRFGSTIVLARLLQPSDFGLVGMATIITGFAALFSDLGLSAATVQDPLVNHRQASSLFWITVTFGATLTLLLSLLSPVVAWIYGRPELLWITVACSSTFIINGLCGQHQALLKRQMRFSTLAFIDILSFAIGIAAAVIAAFVGMGYWALVIMPVATAITQTSGCWLASGWRPGAPALAAGTKALVRFGGYLSAFNIINYLARNADQFLIGWYWGPTSLGFYSRAYNLLLMPITQINAPLNNVMVPGLSRLRDDPQTYARFYLRTVNAISWVTVPLVAVLAAVSNDLFLVLLGPNWIPAGPIFKILAPAALLQPIYNSIGWIFVTQGRTDRMLRWSLLSCPIILLGFVLGLRYGSAGVAWGYVVALLAGVLPWTFGYTFRGTSLTTREVIKSIKIPILISAALFCEAQVLVLLLKDESALMRLWIGTMAPAVSLLAAVRLVTPARREFSSILGTLRKSLQGS
jgi:PST family polysaccharide transporter